MRSATSRCTVQSKEMQNGIRCGDNLCVRIVLEGGITILLSKQFLAEMEAVTLLSSGHEIILQRTLHLVIKPFLP